MRTATLILLAAVMAGGAGGCGLQYAGDRDRFVSMSGGAGYDRGLVVCLSGAGGVCGEVGRISRGLVDGGVACAVESFEWSSGWVMADQADLAANKAKAAILARRIERYQDEYPDCPVHLIGVSAGTGLIVWALEDLGADRQVENVVLLGSSLSSRYDLAAALSHVGGRLYNHHSGADLVLGVLVPVAGTVDRGGGESGGLHGFRLPEGYDENRELYESRLSQVAWQAGDAAYGHGGDHLGGTSPAYVRHRIASVTWARHDGAEPAASDRATVVVATAERP
jgi:pimeloyl-ACP methyl ester carboxylesterase